jgi:hypothetical protein
MWRDSQGKTDAVPFGFEVIVQLFKRSNGITTLIGGQCRRLGTLSQLTNLFLRLFQSVTVF